MHPIPYISTIQIDRLLIFYGFGITILLFAIQAKLSFISRRDHIATDKRARCAGIYRFIKTIFNWGILYFVSSVLLLSASVFSENSNFVRPILYNLSFILAAITTTYLTMAYILLVIKEAVITWITARNFDL